MSDIERLQDDVDRISPFLEEAMQFYPGVYGRRGEGYRLCFSVCGFASHVLRKSFNRRGHSTELLEGIPADTPDNLPDHMKEHVLLKVLPPMLWLTQLGVSGCFLVGVSPFMLRDTPEVAELYPPRQIAVIPSGEEKAFGERLADYAQDTHRRLQKICQGMGQSSLFAQPVIGDGFADLRVGVEEAAKIIADVWHPKRYKPYQFQRGEEVELVSGMQDPDVYMIQRGY